MNAIKSTSISPHHRTSTCPVCRLKDNQALRIVQHSLATFASPYDVLVDLNTKGFTPQDLHGNDITTPNKWRDALRLHVESCLQQSFDTYEKAWRKRKSDNRLQVEFREAAAAHGFELPELIKEAGVTDTNLSELIIQRYIRHDSSMTREELVQAFKNLVPAILVQQLVIISQRQSNYLSGQDRTLSAHDIRAVKECIDMFEKLVGKFGLEDTLD